MKAVNRKARSDIKGWMFPSIDKLSDLVTKGMDDIVNEAVNYLIKGEEVGAYINISSGELMVHLYFDELGSLDIPLSGCFSDDDPIEIQSTINLLKDEIEKLETLKEELLV